ncbi:zf-HC2 domain-containing protein [Streptomyces sp. NPDC001480]|uniref:zf-HC2 domain-containing protein n=1 Tax=Streptomyces sp. NPDC001480 TaxID=3364577 RepID=UPI003697C2E1
MSSDVTCEKLREIGAELALGVLPGRERAGAVAHLDECAECREYIGQLTLVGDGLIGLLPGNEPPVGFETRVAQALTPGTPVHEGRPHARESSVPPRRRRRRVRLRIASAAAALVVAVGFGGWAVGTAIEDVAAGPAATSPGSGTEMLSGDLTSAAVGRKPAGEVYAHAGPQGWVYMTIDLAGAGKPYSGKAFCLLVHRDGTTVPVGALTLHGGKGSWGSPASVDPRTLTGARVTTSDGTVLATARLGASDLAAPAWSA